MESIYIFQNFKIHKMQLFNFKFLCLKLWKQLKGKKGPPPSPSNELWKI